MATAEMEGFEENKLRRHSALIRAKSIGKRPRAVGSHSKNPTAVRSAKDAREISHRRIGDRDFAVSNSFDIENSEIAICDFAN
jgi:hypothetical protein